MEKTEISKIVGSNSHQVVLRQVVERDEDEEEVQEGVNVDPAAHLRTVLDPILFL